LDGAGAGVSFLIGESALFNSWMGSGRGGIGGCDNEGMSEIDWGYQSHYPGQLHPVRDRMNLVLTLGNYRILSQGLKKSLVFY